jgi:hypothetical protein
MTVPFAFANLSGNIALAKLDSNFNTPIIIGNTSVQLGNTVTTLNNLTLANVTITSGTSNVTNVNVTNVNVTNLTATLANITTLNVASSYVTASNVSTAVIGNLTLSNALTVPNGGTGRVTLPVNNVLLGNGTGSLTSVAPGNSGNVLTSSGSAWISNAVPQLTNVAPNTASYILVSANGNLASSRVLTQGGNVTINDNGPGNTIVISATSGSPGGANTTIQFNNSGSFGGSANLTFNGTTLTANTLNLTNQLGTTYGGTGITSFTANGVVYASSSSVLATGSALTYDGSIFKTSGGASYQYLDVLSASGFSGARFSSAGTLGSDSFDIYQGSTYCVINNRANTPIIFYVNNLQQAYLDTTGLGIGKSSPGSKLDVKGTIRLSGATSGYVGLAPAAAAGSTTYTLPSADGTSGQFLSTSGSGTLSWSSAPAATTPGGSNTQVQYNNSSAFAGSANLTFDGTTLTAAGLAGPLNGTVGATTPTTGVFTTAKAIAAATQDSVTLQGRAGGTSSYGVTLTPTTLTASRTLTLPDASGTILQSGTTVTTAQGGTGLTSFTANGVVYASSSSALATGSALTFDGTNLGIGTSSPTQKLDVRGSVYVQRDTNPTNALALQLTNQTTVSNNGCRLSFDVYNIGSAALGVPSDSASLAFYTGGVTSERMRLDSSGNLGLGVTPSAWTGASAKAFETAGGSIVNFGTGQFVSVANAYYNSGWLYKNSSLFATQYQQASGQHVWYTAPSGTAGNAITFTQAMTLDASGNLGIGTTSVNNKLEIAGNIGITPTSSVGFIGLRNTSTTTTEIHVRPNSGKNGLISFTEDGVDDRWVFGIKAGNGSLFFNTGTPSANTDRMVLSSSGNLGVGTASPNASAIIDAQSTTKGVRMPNMTTTQKNAISSPAAGLMVFDTTLAKLCVYSGSAWQTITSV